MYKKYLYGLTLCASMVLSMYTYAMKIPQVAKDALLEALHSEPVYHFVEFYCQITKQEKQEQLLTTFYSSSASDQKEVHEQRAALNTQLREQLDPMLQFLVIEIHAKQERSIEKNILNNKTKSSNVNS